METGNSRYAEFSEVLGQLPFASEAQSVREGRSKTFGAGRRVIAAYDPKQAKGQREKRQSKVDTLVAFGERLAVKLDAQDEGARARARRVSDVGALFHTRARFERELHAARMSHLFTLGFEHQGFSFEVNQAALEKTAAHDGTLVLITNVPDFQPEDLVVHYKSLADIERGFRVLKREVDIAPVYHRKPERLRAHALICFFALLMHRIMRMRLRAARSDTSVERALYTLKAVQLHRVELGTRTLRGLTKMSKAQLPLFEHLAVRKPAAGAV